MIRIGGKVICSAGQLAKMAEEREAAPKTLPVTIAAAPKTLPVTIAAAPKTALSKKAKK